MPAPGAVMLGIERSAAAQSQRAGRSRSDLLAGITAVVLAVSMFLPWFGVAIGSVGVSVTGVHHHVYLYVALALCVVELAYLLDSTRSPGVVDCIPVHREALLAEIRLLNLAIVVVAFFSTGGGGAGWRYGAFMGLGAAVVGTLVKLAVAISQRAGRS